MQAKKGTTQSGATVPLNEKKNFSSLPSHFTSKQLYLMLRFFLEYSSFYCTSKFSDIQRICVNLYFMSLFNCTKLYYDEVYMYSIQRIYQKSVPTNQLNFCFNIVYILCYIILYYIILYYIILYYIILYYIIIQIIEKKEK